MTVLQPPVSAVARVNSDCADWRLSNVHEFTHGTHVRNLTPATPAVTTSAGTTSLTWDYEDRLIGITYPSTATNSFSYNAFGARVSKTDSSGTSTYARNGVSVVAPVLSDGTLTYTPGISSRQGSNSTYSHDDIKNSLRQTSANESTSATLTYDAFGNPVSSAGTWSGPFQYGGPFGYETDTDSGLQLLGHRYNDSSTGRFLSRDHEEDGSNWYSYCQNSPVNSADPFGTTAMVLAPVAPWLITLGPIGAVLLVGLGVATVAILVDEPISQMAVGGKWWRLSLVSPLFLPLALPWPFAEHTKGKRKSIEDKHEKGRAREKADRDPSSPNKNPNTRQKRADEKTGRGLPKGHDRQDPLQNPDYLRPGPKRKGSFFDPIPFPFPGERREL